MHENIAYDYDGFVNRRNVDVTPEGVFRNGKTVCSGYSRLYKYLGTRIGLKVFCASGYAKGIGYKPGTIIEGTNHEWNIIKIDDSFYQIDSTWGSGSINGRKYIKELNDYYFCPSPHNFINSHLPSSDDHQLLEHPISKDEFAKRINFEGYFYDLFTHADIIYQNITVKNRHTFRFFKKRNN